MPITSQQVGGMIGGQQAMFGNFASYSQQISPMAMGGQRGPMPTYANPMAGSAQTFAPPPMYASGADQFGAQALSAIGNIGIPGIATAGMVGGMMLPGGLGRAAGMLDPFGAAYQGLRGGLGVGQAGGWGKALGGIARGGMGTIARAGIAGVGGAALAAAAPLAVMEAGRYAVGQMVEGAQYQNQVGGFLQNQFRHLNAQSETGFGFGRQERNQIADVLRNLGHQEIMSTPQEMMRIMQQGTSMGMFRAVQDAQSFKEKFTGMVKTLKEVAKTMNTTLEGAMPFLGEARRMGFWRPEDITGQAATAQGVATNAGISVAQAQGMMGQGAAMSRSMGGLGMHGATGMARTLELVGGMQRSGFISERMMSEITGGQMGPAATQAFAGQIAQGTARFARSSHGRWMMAALGGSGFRGLDAGQLARLKAGAMNLSDIRSDASRNIGREGAANFVMNEETLRGQLMSQGPEVQMGLVRAAIGERLHGEGGMDKLYTRRMIQRMFGVGGRQADVLAKMAREMPQIMEENKRRTASMIDQQERNREQMMDSGLGEVKRNIGKWWDQSVRQPLQEMGASIASSWSDSWRDFSDSLVGRTLQRHRLRGVSAQDIKAVTGYIGGDRSGMDLTFGDSEVASQIAYGGGTGLRGNQGWLLRRAGLPSEGAAGLEAISQQRSALGSTLTGYVSNASVQAMGWSGRQEALGDIGGAREAINNPQFRMAAAMMRQNRAQRASALNIDDDGSGRWAMQYGESLVKAIERGDKGFDDPSLRKLVAGGGTMREKVMRLATAQRQAKGGFGFGQIDLSTEYEDAGGGPNRGEAAENIGEFIDDAQMNLVRAVGRSQVSPITGEKMRGWGSHSVDNVRSLTEKKATAPAFKRAMKLMAQADKTSDPDKKAALEGRATRLLQGIGAREDTTAGERAFIADLIDPENPNRENVKKMMAQTGVGYQAKSEENFKDTIRRRSQRMMQSLGERAEEVFGALEEMRPEESGRRSIGEIVRGLTREGVGAREWAGSMEELAETAVAMGAEDAARAAAAFEGVAGAEHIQAALAQGAQLAGVSDRLTKRGGVGRATSGEAGYLLRQAAGQSVKMTDRQLRDIRSGSDEKAAKAREEILSKIKDEDAKRATGAMLTTFQQKDTEGAIRLATEAVAQRGARGIARTDADKIAERMETAKAGEVVGRLGSQAGIHAELSRQTQVLENIYRAGGVLSRDPTFNKKEPPEKE
jgi:hypothetical protein